jgi:protein Mpv17
MCRCLFGQEKERVAIVARGAMMGMKGAWVWYRFRLQQQPIRTQMVTSGILWAIGDAIAQSISRSIEQRLVMKENSTTTIVSVHTIMASLLPLHLFSFFKFLFDATTHYVEFINHSMHQNYQISSNKKCELLQREAFRSSSIF